MSDMYISFSIITRKFLVTMVSAGSNSQYSIPAVEPPSLKISFHGTSLK